MANQLSISGNVTRDAEFHQGANGNGMCRFTIAWNPPPRRDAQGQRQEEPGTFVVVKFFDRDAQYIASLVKKGQRWGAVGRLVQERWQDQQGQNRETFCLHVSFPDFVAPIPQAPRQQQFQDPSQGQQWGGAPPQPQPQYGQQQPQQQYGQPQPQPQYPSQGQPAYGAPAPVPQVPGYAAPAGYAPRAPMQQASSFTEAGT